MSSEGNGRLSFLLKPHRNSKGPYFMGRTNLKASTDLDSKAIFAYPQADGSLLVTLEEYVDPAGQRKKAESLPKKTP